MRRQILHVTLPACVAIVVAGAWLSYAGDLNPPSGPVNPTMKTLVEVEPRIAVNETTTPGDADSLFKIAEPGSYYLTRNITGESGKHGIEIVASGVTVDLVGFEVAGVAGSLDGVVATIAVQNITIQNGTVRAWGQDGVDLSSVDVGHIEKVHAHNNAGKGIHVLDNFIITTCISGVNGSDGIKGRFGNVISQCTAHANIGEGITMSTASTITGCMVKDNTGRGMTATGGSTIENCCAVGNGSHGIFGKDCTIRGCVARNNTENGIYGDRAAKVLDCTANSNTQAGIRGQSHF